MISRTAGVIAATALTAANALLIPPGVASVDSPFDIALLNADWQTVKLPCPDCIFSNPNKQVKEAADDDNAFTITGGAKSIMVNVTTLWGGNSIGLKDYPLYPPLRSYGKPMVDFMPSQVALDSADRFPVKVTADTEVVTEETVAPKGDAVIRIKYQILAINQQPITVDAIEITALKTSDKKLSLMNVEPVPKANSIFDSLPVPAGKSDNKHPSAKTPCHLPPVLCHFRDVVETKMSELKAGMPPVHFSGFRGGCNKGNKWRGKDGITRLPTHIRPGHPHFGHFDKDAPRPDGHRGNRPFRHGRPHMHHFHHGHRHGLVHKVLMGFMFVLVPMVLGVAMGMVVSILGMIVGRLIAFLWVKFVRGGKKGYASVRLDEGEADAEDDKEDLESVVSEDLPRYEEVPEYSEKQSA